VPFAAPRRKTPHERVDGLPVGGAPADKQNLLTHCSDHLSPEIGTRTRFVAGGKGCVTLGAMSTLAEIEEAVGMLPAAQRKVLLLRLARRFGGRAASCYDLARELFEKPGQLGASGHRDLSTNKQHLAGFGRSKTVR
jgi:hypothetical protein